LRDEAAADGELQNRLFQAVDRRSPVEQQVEVGRDVLPVLSGFCRRGAVGQRVEQGAGQPLMLLGRQSPRFLQRIAQGHQFIDAGDDAGLFGLIGEREHN
jgi:hypothetical protein